MKVPLLKKIIVFDLALIVTVQIALGSYAESNLWEQRRKARGSDQPAALNHRMDVANLPAGTPPALRPAAQPLSLIRANESTLRRWDHVPASLKDLVQILPLTNVSIQEIQNGTSPDASPVLLIQDVHMNTEAQTNVAAALNRVIESHAARAVGVEGAFSPFDFSRLRAFPEKDVVKKVADDFLNANLLAASSYAGIVSNSPPPLFIGVDDETHYRANVRAYLDSRAEKSAVSKRLAQLYRELNERKARTFSPLLKEFDDRREAYQRGTVGFSAYLTFLTRQPAGLAGSSLAVQRYLEAARLESTLNFGAVEQERRHILEKLTVRLSEAELKLLLEESVAYKSGRLGFGDYYQSVQGLCLKHDIRLAATTAFQDYLRYVFLADGIRTRELLEELDRLETAGLDNLHPSQEERALIQQSRHLELARKLIDFSLMPKEWEKYKNTRDEITSSLNLSPFERFYEEADMRSQKMLENILLARPVAEDRRPLVLVTGGFHTDEITQSLKGKGIPYLVASPKLTKVDATQGSEYLSIFAREKTPLEQLLSGEKLFLAVETTQITCRGTFQGFLLRVLARIKLKGVGVTDIKPSPAGPAFVVEVKADDSEDVISIPRLEFLKRRFLKPLAAGGMILREKIGLANLTGRDILNGFLAGGLLAPMHLIKMSSHFQEPSFIHFARAEFLLIWFLLTPLFIAASVFIIIRNEIEDFKVSHKIVRLASKIYSHLKQRSFQELFKQALLTNNLDILREEVVPMLGEVERFERDLVGAQEYQKMNGHQPFFLRSTAIPFLNMSHRLRAELNDLISVLDDGFWIRASETYRLLSAWRTSSDVIAARMREAQNLLEEWPDEHEVEEVWATLAAALITYWGWIEISILRQLMHEREGIVSPELADDIRSLGHQVAHVRRVEDTRPDRQGIETLLATNIPVKQALDRYVSRTVSLHVQGVLERAATDIEQTFRKNIGGKLGKKTPAGMIGLWYYPIHWGWITADTAARWAFVEEFVFSWAAFNLLPQIFDSWGLPAWTAVFLTYLITNILFALAHPNASRWVDGKINTENNSSYWQGVKKNFWTFFVMGMAFRWVYLLSPPHGDHVVVLISAIFFHAFWNNSLSYRFGAPVGISFNYWLDPFRFRLFTIRSEYPEINRPRANAIARLLRNKKMRSVLISELADFLSSDTNPLPKNFADYFIRHFAKGITETQEIDIQNLTDFVLVLEQDHQLPFDLIDEFVGYRRGTGFKKIIDEKYSATQKRRLSILLINEFRERFPEVFDEFIREFDEYGPFLFSTTASEFYFHHIAEGQIAAAQDLPPGTSLAQPMAAVMELAKESPGFEENLMRYHAIVSMERAVHGRLEAGAPAVVPIMVDLEQPDNNTSLYVELAPGYDAAWELPALAGLTRPVVIIETRTLQRLYLEEAVRVLGLAKSVHFVDAGKWPLDPVGKVGVLRIGNLKELFVNRPIPMVIETFISWIRPGGRILICGNAHNGLSQASDTDDLFEEFVRTMPSPINKYVARQMRERLIGSSSSWKMRMGHFDQKGIFVETKTGASDPNISSSSVIEFRNQTAPLEKFFSLSDHFDYFSGSVILGAVLFLLRDIFPLMPYVGCFIVVVWAGSIGLIGGLACVLNFTAGRADRILRTDPIAMDPNVNRLLRKFRRENRAKTLPSWKLPDTVLAATDPSDRVVRLAPWLIRQSDSALFNFFRGLLLTLVLAHEADRLTNHPPRISTLLAFAAKPAHLLKLLLVREHNVATPLAILDLESPGALMQISSLLGFSRRDIPGFRVNDAMEYDMRKAFGVYDVEKIYGQLNAVRGWKLFGENSRRRVRRAVEHRFDLFIRELRTRLTEGLRQYSDIEDLIVLDKWLQKTDYDSTAVPADGGDFRRSFIKDILALSRIAQVSPVPEQRQVAKDAAVFLQEVSLPMRIAVLRRKSQGEGGASAELTVHDFKRLKKDASVVPLPEVNLAPRFAPLFADGDQTAEQLRQKVMDVVNELELNLDVKKLSPERRTGTQTGDLYETFIGKVDGDELMNVETKKSFREKFALLFGKILTDQAGLRAATTRILARESQTLPGNSLIYCFLTGTTEDIMSAAQKLLETYGHERSGRVRRVIVVDSEEAARALASRLPAEAWPSPLVIQRSPTESMEQIESRVREYWNDFDFSRVRRQLLVTKGVRFGDQFFGALAETERKARYPIFLLIVTEAFNMLAVEFDASHLSDLEKFAEQVLTQA